MQIKVCDRCGRVIHAKADYQIYVVAYGKSEVFDMCEDCIYKLKDWMVEEVHDDGIKLKRSR